MPKFKCEYEDGDVLLSAKVWKLNVVADDHRQAYEKFIEEVGVFKYRVYVGKGFKGEYFSDHIEEVKIIEKQKLELSKQERAAKAKKEKFELSKQERAAKVESTELTDILEMLKQIDSNIKSYGSRILWVLVVIAMGIMGIKFLLD